MEGLQKQPPSYLFEDLEARLRKAQVVFNLVLKPAKGWDPTDDPTAPWPDDSPRAGIGRLGLGRPTTVEEEIGDPVMLHDPTRLTYGTEASDGPILAVRRGVFEVPVAHRTRWVEGTSGRSGTGWFTPFAPGTIEIEQYSILDNTPCLDSYSPFCNTKGGMKHHTLRT